MLKLNISTLVTNYSTKNVVKVRSSTTSMTATGFVIGAMAGMVYGLYWSYYTEPVSDKIKGVVK